MLPMSVFLCPQVGRLATCLGSPMCDIHEVHMEVAARAAATAMQGSGGRGAWAGPKGQSGIQTDAEEVRRSTLCELVTVPAWQ